MSDFLARAYKTYLPQEAPGARSAEEYFAGRAPYLAELVSKSFPAAKDVKIVDLGCGSGAMIHAARQAGYNRISGVDISEAQVQIAQALGIPDVHQGDLLETIRKVPSEDLDVVVTLDVIEHLSKDAVCALGDEIHRALKPGGRWIIHAPNAESPFFGAVLYGDLTHQTAFTARSIAQLTALVGFSGLEVHEDRPVPHGPFSLIRNILWTLLRLPLRAYLAIELGVAKDKFIFSQNLLAVATK